jgi:hypothetical protein
MVDFHKRIKELSDMLDSEFKSLHTSREIAMFREKYFAHLKELNPYTGQKHLNPMIDQYKYLLYQANKSFRHDNARETKRFLNKALILSQSIMYAYQINDDD